MPALTADTLRDMDPATKGALLSTLTDEEATALLYDWRFWARPNQIMPDSDWITWLIMAGRGFGKTRAGAEAVREAIETHGCMRVALVAKTAADARDVMVEGESGLMSVFPPGMRPNYEPSKRRVTWPNGAIATCYSSKEPDQLRGPQHDFAWADEPAAWIYPQETWDQLMFGLRLGEFPRCVATTTPKPIGLVKMLLDDPTCVVSSGTTFENAANLAPAFYHTILTRYEGTTLGRQEIYAEVLSEIPGALWSRADIRRASVPDDLVRVVVAIDPAASSNDGSDQTGIIVAALGADGYGYVLEDRSLRASPDGWGRAAVDAYQLWNADLVVGERNNGGEMIEHVIKTVEPTVNYKSVFASRGKQTRAEPIAALYEQGRVFHTSVFTDLEDQMCTWVPGQADSPDHLDAMVWAFTELMLGTKRKARFWKRKPGGL